jgi:hypothetical protein
MSKSIRRGKREREARKRHRRGSIWSNRAAGTASAGQTLKLGNKKSRIWHSLALQDRGGGRRTSKTRARTGAASVGPGEAGAHDFTGEAGASV